MRSPRAALLALGLVQASCVSKPPALRVLAAASLAEVLQEAAAAFEARDGIKVEASFASSSLLAQQILSGARADVFVSANSEWMSSLAREERVDPIAITDLSGNRLVLIVPSGAPPLGLDDLARPFVRRIAIADPEYVPAGVYAKTALRTLGIWQGVEGKVLSATDTRAALAYVARGEAECGIVYRTDAEVSDRVRTELIIPEESYPPIRYPAAVLKSAARAADAARFVEFLASPEARGIWRRHGFE